MNRKQKFLPVVLVASLLATSVSHSKVTSKETEIVHSVFDFNTRKFAVRKLGIRLVQVNDEYMATITALLSNGETQSGQVQCEKKKPEVFFCHRDNDGGDFTLQTGKIPKLTYTCFSTAEEGSLNNAAIGCVDNLPTTVESKNRP